MNIEKELSKIYHATYYKKNKERIKSKTRRAYNPELKKQYNKEYYLNNKEKWF